LHLRFTHIFTALMLIAMLCAVRLPGGTSMRIGGSLQSLFAPIAGPMHWLGGTMQSLPGKHVDDMPIEPGITDERRRLIEENRALKSLVARLSTQLDLLKSKVAVADWLPPELAERSVILRVIGKADGPRQILKLTGTDRGVVGGEVVVFQQGGSTGLVGKVMEGVGAGHQAQVRLITDVDTTFVVRAGRLERDGFVALPTKEPLLVEGTGRNELRVRNLSMMERNTIDLRVGDQILLAGPDTEWPVGQAGFRVGTVTAISENRLQPLFAEVRIAPEVDLSRLREVTVILRENGQ
jgi:cell shape-determining protein MreC